MLFKVNRDAPSSIFPYSLDRMTVTYYPMMSLFHQEIITRKPPNGNDESASASGRVEESFFVRVTYKPPPDGEGNKPQEARIEIPLRPDVATLDALDIELHRSPTKAYDMGPRCNDWFSARFGWETMLVYLGPHLRPVLGNLAPAPTAKQQNQNSSSWFTSLARQLPLVGSALAAPAKEEEGLTFADVAAYLVVTEESLADVSRRFSEGMEADVTKFRPNIVLSGAKDAYEEDFWAELGVTTAKERKGSAAAGSRKEDSGGGGGRVVFDLTQNCGRCKSLNIDYSTGAFGKGEVGSMLKKMMKDRRVDMGNKWSPIFGRYGFLGEGDGRNIAVGDEVEVLRRNEERTTFGELVGFAVIFWEVADL